MPKSLHGFVSVRGDVRDLSVHRPLLGQELPRPGPHDGFTGRVNRPGRSRLASWVSAAWRRTGLCTDNNEVRSVAGPAEPEGNDVESSLTVFSDTLAGKSKNNRMSFVAP